MQLPSPLPDPRQCGTRLVLHSRLLGDYYHVRRRSDRVPALVFHSRYRYSYHPLRIIPRPLDSPERNLFLSDLHPADTVVRSLERTPRRFPPHRPILPSPSLFWTTLCNPCTHVTMELHTTCPRCCQVHFSPFPWDRSDLVYEVHIVRVGK